MDGGKRAEIEGGMAYVMAHLAAVSPACSWRGLQTEFSLTVRQLLLQKIFLYSLLKQPCAIAAQRYTKKGET